jgi:hypothetical protein
MTWDGVLAENCAADGKLVRSKLFPKRWFAVPEEGISEQPAREFSPWSQAGEPRSDVVDRFDWVAEQMPNRWGESMDGMGWFG